MADSSLPHPARSHDIFSENLLKELHFHLNGICVHLRTLMAEGGPPNCPKMGVKIRRKLRDVFAELWYMTDEVKRLLPPA